MSGLSDRDFAFLRDLVYSEAAIVVGEDKKYLMEARLAALADRHMPVGLAPLLGALRRGEDAGLRRHVAEAMAIHETYFFRDHWLTETLREQVLPALIRARQDTRTLRIWCAACSSGQEPYSIGMLLRESFPQLAGWDITLLATDFSREILEQARRGHYALGEVNRGLPTRLLMRWFSQHGLDWAVRPEIRDMVEFRELNLASERWPLLPDFDLVLLRNVLIYFDDRTRQGVLGRVAGTLRHDGFLVLGGAEVVNEHPAYRLALPGKVLPCYRRTGAMNMTTGS